VATTFGLAGGCDVMWGFALPNAATAASMNKATIASGRMGQPSYESYVARAGAWLLAMYDIVIQLSNRDNITLRPRPQALPGLRPHGDSARGGCLAGAENHVDGAHSER
jgi:hypothetical protein